MAYNKPSAEGRPFASDEWKGYCATLDKHAQGTKPVSRAATSTVLPRPYCLMMCRRWAEAPKWEMANIHLVFFELFERVYLFADYAVERDDLANYLGFAEDVFFNIYKHHDLEESLLFPQMTEAAGTDHWQSNVVEHQTFAENLEAAMLYVRFCRQNLDPAPPLSPVPEPTPELMAAYGKYSALDAKKPFDPSTLREHLDKVITGFGKHMTTELDTLDKEIIEEVGEKAYSEISARQVKRLQSYGPEWFLCIAVASMSIELLRQVLPLPLIVRKGLLPFIWAPKFAAWWKYCQYPENLTFFGSP